MSSVEMTEPGASDIRSNRIPLRVRRALAFSEHQIPEVTHKHTQVKVVFPLCRLYRRMIAL